MKANNPDEFYSIWSHCPFCGAELDTDPYWDDETVAGDCISCDAGYFYEDYGDSGVSIEFYDIIIQLSDFTLADYQYVNMRIYQEGGQPDWAEFRYYTIEEAEAEDNYDGVPF